MFNHAHLPILTLALSIIQSRCLFICWWWIFSQTGFGNHWRSSWVSAKMRSDLVRWAERQSVMIPLFLLPDFTWGCWIPGNGENSQVTLSANHIMIYFIPPPHHTTHYRVSHRGILINPGKKCLAGRQRSISKYDRALFLTRQGHFHGYDCIVEIFKILQSTLAPHWHYCVVCITW